MPKKTADGTKTKERLKRAADALFEVRTDLMELSVTHDERLTAPD